MAIQFLRGSGVSYSTLNSLAIGQPYYDYTNNRLYIGDGNTARTSDDECDPVNQNYWNQLFYCYRSGTAGYAYAVSCSFKTKTVGTTATLAGISNTLYIAGYSSIYAPANGSCSAIAASTSSSGTIGNVYAVTGASTEIGEAVHYIKAANAYFTIYYGGVTPYYTSVNGTMTYYPYASSIHTLSTGTYAPSAVTLLSAERNC